MTHSPESLVATIDRITRLRAWLVESVPPPTPDGSLMPILTRSAEVSALDVALRVLGERLREEAS